MTFYVSIPLITEKLDERNVYNIENIDNKVSEFIKDTKHYIDFLFNGDLVLKTNSEECSIQIDVFCDEIKENSSKELFEKVIYPFIRRSFKSLGLPEISMVYKKQMDCQLNLRLDSENELFLSIKFGEIDNLLMDIGIFKDYIQIMYAKDTIDLEKDDNDFLYALFDLKIKDGLVSSIDCTFLNDKNKENNCLEDKLNIENIDKLNVLLYYMNTIKFKNDEFNHYKNSNSIRSVFKSDKNIFKRTLEELKITDILSY